MGLVALDYVVIILMLSISATIGLYFHFSGGKQKTTKEFLMAGKNMSIFPVAFSLMATYMSAISLMGVAAEVYMYGTQVATWSFGIPFGALLVAYLFLPIFFDMEACTAYQYLEKRFGKAMRQIVSLVFIFQTVLYMAVVLYAPSLALNAVTDLSTWTSVLSLSTVCIFYCSLGGLKAVLWTDVFQAILMFVTLVSVIVRGTVQVGGIQKVLEIANNGGRIIFNELSPDLITRYTLWNCLFNGVFFAVSTFGTNQAQIQRLLSVRTAKKGQKALFLGVPLIMIFSILCAFNGIIIYALFHDCDPIQMASNNSISSADQLLPYAIVNMFESTPGLSGLCICGIFSAALSTLSSALNSLTTVTMEDFVKPYLCCRKFSESWATFVAKMIGIGYGGLCLIMTVIVANFRGIAEASGVLFAVFGGPILGVFALGMFTTTANQKGTLIGLLAGLAISSWLGFGSYANKIVIPTLPRSIEGCDVSGDLFYPSNSSLNTSVDHTKLSDDAPENILYIYRISYMWFHIFGTVTVLVIGYISSFIFGLRTEQKSVEKMLISPIFRKWYFQIDQRSCQEEVEFELLR